MDYNNVWVVDIESPPQCFLLCAFHPGTREKIKFIINHKQDDLYKLIKWLDNNKNIPFVGWNILNFDIQVIEFIYRNYEEWYELKGL